MSEIRYAKITLIDGTRFILRVTKESPAVVRGYEVNAEGDEVVPPGACNRLRIVGREFIAKIVEMRMNNTYATLEAAPRAEGATKIVSIVTKSPAQLDAEIAEALHRKRSARKKIPRSYRRLVEEAADLIDRGESDATILMVLKNRGLPDSDAQLLLDAARP